MKAQACFEARNQYLSCLEKRSVGEAFRWGGTLSQVSSSLVADERAIGEDGSTKDALLDSSVSCKAQLSKYKSSCPESWRNYFAERK